MNQEIKAVQVMHSAIRETPQSYALLHAQVDFLRAKTLIERIPDRQHVGIDFFFQRAGKKAQAFARLHRALHVRAPLVRGIR